MHKTSIESALKLGQHEAVKEIHGNPNDTRAIWARLGPTALEPLVAALRAHPDVCELEGKYAHTAQGDFEINFERISGYLIERTFEHEPKRVADDFIRLVNCKTYTWIEVQFLEYCKLDHRIDLGDGFTVIPLKELSKEYAPTRIAAQLLLNREHLDPKDITPVIRERELPLGIGDAPICERLPVPPHATLSSDWDAILNAIILAGKGAPKWGLKYCFFKDPGWMGMSRNGGGRGDNHFGPVDVVKEVDAAVLNRIFQPLRKVSPGLLLAIKMLAKARRRKFEETEKVIDLGTCAEVLLMNKSQENNEISMKVGLRAAWYLNGGAARRVEIFRTFRDLYKLRSIAVHTGEMPRAKGVHKRQEQAKCILDVDSLLVCLLRKMLSEGVPADADWSSIVLDAENI